MLTEKELKFIEHWEKNRIVFSSFSSKLKRGMPMALIFSFPILLSLAAVYFFSPDWYTKISQTANGSFFVIIMSTIISALFFSFTRMHFKWEMNEQFYRELISKKKKYQ
jgi:hypothetical protein